MRYLRNILWGFVAWLLTGTVIHIPTFFISGVLHPALCEWFPEVFTDYSPVTQPDEYAVYSAVMSIVLSTVTVFIISYLCVRLDNERMEYVISRTEGLYTLREGMALYYPRYVGADLAVAVTCPIPLAVISLYLPEKIPAILQSTVDYFFSFTQGYVNIFGALGAVLVISATILLCRLLSGMLSLRAWQGVWLSETG